MPFPYEKLRGKGAIRLLTIQPGASDDSVVCTLNQKITLQDIKESKTSYDALSYRWGSQDPLFPITVDSHDFQVGTNLNDALRIMRLPDKSRIVWIDAICINQGSDKAAKAERAVQVKMMQDIYGLATQTVIWLGPEEHESNLAMDFITYQAIMEPTRAKLDMDTRWKGWTTEDDFFYIAREPRFVPVWEALFSLCRREYWSRMWIIQEIALSSDPVVHCGEKMVKWVDFELVIGLIFAMVADRVPGAMYFWHLGPLLEANFPLLLETQRSQMGSKKTAKWLLGALQRYRVFNATEPADKVVGFLGLVDQTTRDAVKVDYDAPLKKFYFEVWKLLVPRKRWVETENDTVTGEAPMMSMSMSFNAAGEIISETSATPESRRHGPLNILGSASHKTSLYEELPSWVPDWSDKTIRNSIDNLTHNVMRVSGDLEPDYSFRSSNKILKTKGFEFGGLRWIASSPAKTEVNGRLGIHDDALIAAAADGMLDAITAGIAGHEFNEGRFWRALVFNAFPTAFFDEAPDVWERMSIDVLREFITGGELSDESNALLPSEYIIMLRKTLIGRAFAVTLDGFYVVVPAEATLGDKVCVIHGCDVPVVLGMRDDKLVLIGECYCDVLVDGSWLKRMDPASLKSLMGTFRIS